MAALRCLLVVYIMWLIVATLLSSANSHGKHTVAYQRQNVCAQLVCLQSCCGCKLHEGKKLLLSVGRTLRLNN